MATYRQPRIDYSAADAVRELSTLMLTMAFQQHEKKEQRAWQEGVTERAREYQATVSMYQDSKQQERDARLAYEKVEDAWVESGLGLQSLNEMFKTDKSLKVLKDLNAIPAKDLKQREQYFSDKAYNLERKADILEGVLHGDIRKAKNIMAGGAGQFGGEDKLEWDMEDLGLKAYEQVYDKASGIVEEYFEANPAAMRTALSKLEQGELNIELLREKTGYYGRLGLAAKEKAVYQRRERIGKYFQSGLAISEERSGLNKYNEQNRQLSIMMDEPDAYTPSDMSEKQEMVIAEREAIGIKFGSLMGDRDLTDAKISDYFERYNQIHTLSRSKVGTHVGVISDPDFQPYWDSIETAFATFKAEQNTERKAVLEETAQEMFGFYGSFDEFVDTVQGYKSEYMLAPFKGNGQIDDDDDDPGTVLTDNEWENILGED
mgnify:CR=1 FL=1